MLSKRFESISKIKFRKFGGKVGGGGEPREQGKRRCVCVADIRECQGPLIAQPRALINQDFAGGRIPKHAQQKIIKFIPGFLS